MIPDDTMYSNSDDDNDERQGQLKKLLTSGSKCRKCSCLTAMASKWQRTGKSDGNGIVWHSSSIAWQ